MNKQLTDEEIEALTDEQLRIECAKLQGWVIKDSISLGEYMVPNESFTLAGFGNWERIGQYSAPKGQMPNYPNDLNAAWGLFTPFQAKGRSVGMRSRGFRHQAFIYDGPGSDWIPSDDDLYAEADLPGRAICRVVLKASRSNR